MAALVSYTAATGGRVEGGREGWRIEGHGTYLAHAMSLYQPPDADVDAVDGYRVGTIVAAHREMVAMAHTRRDLRLAARLVDELVDVAGLITVAQWAALRDVGVRTMKSYRRDRSELPAPCRQPRLGTRSHVDLWSLRQCREWETSRPKFTPPLNY